MSDAMRAGFTATSLRMGWQCRSMESGWAFPSDWYCPAIDALCEALVLDTDAIRPSAQRLGRERARIGVALAEALADIDTLAGLVPDHGDVLRRSLSLGWADQVAVGADAVVDPLTGLNSVDYLQARLKEIYRSSVLRGERVGRTHAIVVVRLMHTANATWAQTLPMITVARALETVFSAGQSLSRLGPVVAAALTPRSPTLPRQSRLLSQILRTQLVGPSKDTAAPTPQVWIEALPDAYQAACDLLGSLRR